MSLGYFAGHDNQGENSIAIGVGAGQTKQGKNCVAIGCGAGKTEQFTHSIVINAGEDDVSASSSGFFVNPVRQNGQTKHKLYYNEKNKEIVYNADYIIVKEGDSVDLWEDSYTISEGESIKLINNTGGEVRVWCKSCHLVDLENRCMLEIIALESVDRFSIKKSDFFYKKSL